jgi:hypothetical protein
MNNFDEINKIHARLKMFKNYNSIYIKEFTFGIYRIDAIIIDLKHRWVRGFEIKISKDDFNQDYKWTEYAQFLSSLSIVCPWGIISHQEVGDPFGLLWINLDNNEILWKKRPKRFNRRNSLGWLWTYLRVLEAEMPRLMEENRLLTNHIQALESRLSKIKN